MKSVRDLLRAPAEAKEHEMDLMGAVWSLFRLADLFEIKSGKVIQEEWRSQEGTPLVSATTFGNGVSGYIDVPPWNPKNTISVASNGNGVGEAFFQDEPYCCTADVTSLHPKGFELTPAVGLFICTMIRKERYRFSYGRKWGRSKMLESTIRLPSKVIGEDLVPDFVFMEQYIRSLPFSSQI